MSAHPVPNEGIPELAKCVTLEMLNLLRLIQKTGYIKNRRGIDQRTLDLLGQLVGLGLADPGNEGDTHSPPASWISNGNGSRVLVFLTGIRSGPHYEISAPELAEWLEDEGKERWWNVDGDPILTGRMTFPSPAAGLASELRKINRALLVQAKMDDEKAKGQIIGKAKLSELVSHFANGRHQREKGQEPQWSDDRLLYLCWKGTFHEWLLAEDSETAEQSKADEIATAN